jgi:hypothetical protein
VQDADGVRQQVDGDAQGAQLLDRFTDECFHAGTVQAERRDQATNTAASEEHSHAATPPF